MIRTTPFHERTAALNETQLWSHWSGHLAADRYQMSDKFEYFAVRNAAGVFDSSPLYKYRIHGTDAPWTSTSYRFPGVRKGTVTTAEVASRISTFRAACPPNVIVMPGAKPPPRTSTSGANTEPDVGEIAFNENGDDVSR